MEALKSEDNPINLQNLFWTGVAYINENRETESNFPNIFIPFLLHLVVQPEKSPMEVTLSALSVMSELAPLFQSFKKGKELGVNLVLSLAKYLEFEMNTANVKEPPGEPILVATFSCIMNWVMQGQWIVKEKESLKKVFSVLEIGMGLNHKTKEDGVKQYFCPSPKVQEAAEYVLTNMLNLMDSVPGPMAANPLSFPLSEEELCETHGMQMKDFSLYVFDSTIISVFKHNDNVTPLVTILLRDAFGKYAWTCEQQFQISNDSIEEKYPGKSTNIFEKRTPASNAEMSEDDTRFFLHLMDLLDAAEKKRLENLLEKAKERQSAEKSVLQSRNFGLNVDISAKRPPTVPDPPSARLFLTNFGFLSLINQARFHGVRPGNVSLANLKSIDLIRERDCFTAGLVLVRTKEELFMSKVGSTDYNSFVNSLGWPVCLRDHIGFKGGVENATHFGEYAPYYANYESEVVFHVTSLMPNIDGGAHKKRLLKEDKVWIFWVEDLETYESKMTVFKQMETWVHIVIHPLKSGLFSIRVFRFKPWNQIFGPLLDEMVVSKYILAAMVRQTTINALRLLREDKTKPFVRRRQAIEEFIQIHRSVDNLHEFYGNQFAQ
eukprot:TRINITY_DN5017_c0_g1_i2.p1 TRINITY_DN5017_c0_g1~~TRINITY_DN5017_c0_g1_i2.p1  ORF type:complete len:704 (+),score=170.77 TRINITY_DN5017_c0_g1_i2:298-2112(+)